MNWLRFICLLLVVIGALNWGLIGFFKFDLLSTIFAGEFTTIARIVYAIVGLAGLYCISLLCCSGSCKCGPGCQCCKK